MCSAFFLCVFFFKQKTAYEMRISDWSSDVCSSDLVLVRVEKRRDDVLYINDGAYGSLFDAAHVAWRFPVKLVREKESAARPLNFSFYGPTRSEEHTSELQSLMRISYAVFCLKKKTAFTRVTTDQHREQ